ncbi:uncharacterized protein LOC109928635 [Rhincodon typus]|uniref:uncharacterized protein LOC109928635 n=1 Tax=Rhincodon typus TaxID=259920 RepID=UPI00202EC2DE|nr:uncharacterized protein LOC109928635 [Rhincodon typus]
MAARRGKVARRFSDTSLEVLVAAVRARAKVLFPRSGKKVHSSLSKKAWLEVAEEVSRLSITPRTWIQCRKRFNDLTRSAREKAAHNMRERSRLGGGTTDVVALSPVEQSAMDISGTSKAISIGDGEAGGFSKHTDCFTIVPLHMAQAIPVSIKTSPSPPPPREVFEEEPSEEDKPAASLSSGSAELAEPEQDKNEAEGPAPLSGTEREREGPGPGPEMSRRRALPSPGPADWDGDSDLRDPAIKRKMLEAHQRLYQVLEGLPKTLSAMSESMEESTSAMCGVVSHVVSTLQSTLESTTTPRESALAEPPQPETPSPTVEALIEAQTAAIQALGANVCSALERMAGQLDTLVDRVDRGFETVSHLLRSALPQTGGSEETKPRAGGGASCPFPPSPLPCAALVPNRQLSQGALAAAPKALQPEGTPPRARAPRSQRSPRASQEAPANSCLTGGTSRRSGKVSKPCRKRKQIKSRTDLNRYYSTQTDPTCPLAPEFVTLSSSLMCSAFWKRLITCPVNTNYLPGSTVNKCGAGKAQQVRQHPDKGFRLETFTFPAPGMLFDLLCFSSSTFIDSQDLAFASLNQNPKNCRCWK